VYTVAFRVLTSQLIDQLFLIIIRAIKAYGIVSVVYYRIKFLQVHLHAFFEVNFNVPKSLQYALDSRLLVHHPTTALIPAVNLVLS
jgi:hypothetical protein